MLQLQSNTLPTTIAIFWWIFWRLLDLLLLLKRLPNFLWNPFYASRLDNIWISAILCSKYIGERPSYDCISSRNPNWRRSIYNWTAYVKKSRSFTVKGDPSETTQKLLKIGFRRFFNICDENPKNYKNFVNGSKSLNTGYSRTFI